MSFPWSAEELRRKVVVCDNGTGFVKCGFAGDKSPRGVFPCILGRPLVRFEEQPTQEAVKGLYVGNDCTEHRQFLEVSYPISNGIVNNWGDMRYIWDHTFYEQLQVDPTECKILLTDPPQNPRANRERMLATMFETYGFEGAYIQIQAVLTLYSQGLLTGVVVDSGDGVTHAVPVIDGFSPSLSIRRLNVAGRHVTSHLVDLLLRRGYTFNRTADFDTIRQLKEQVCYVAHDFSRETRVFRETTFGHEQYTLPDGRIISVAAERFMAPEVLFTPAIINIEGAGMSEMVFDCIQANDMDSRMRLYEHVVLSGGSTMFPGLPTRMEKELKALYVDRVLKGRGSATRKFKLRVEDPPRRRHMVFVGGAVLSDIMKDREDFWVSKEEWEEDPHRALLKCGES